MKIIFIGRCVTTDASTEKEAQTPLTEMGKGETDSKAATTTSMADETDSSTATPVVLAEVVENQSVAPAPSTTESQNPGEGEAQTKDKKAEVTTRVSPERVVRKTSSVKPGMKTGPTGSATGSTQARSQVPRLISAANSNASATASNKLSESSSSKAASVKPSSSSTTTSSSLMKIGSTRSTVVGRSRTVDLGKMVGSSSNKKPEPPTKVVRQMSASALQPVVTAGNKTVTTNNSRAQLSAAGKFSLRVKPDSPKRNVVASSLTKGSDDVKKTAKTGITCFYICFILILDLKNLLNIVL